jgi:hypothetical protein
VAPERATLPVLGARLAAYAAAMLTAGLVYGPAFYDRGDAFEVRALRLFPRGRAATGQLPLLGLMVAYIVLGLFLLFAG